MNKSPRRDLEVFDLKEEDEIADIASGKQLRNFKSPSLDHQSVLKYEFLEYVSQVDNVSIKEGCSIPCVDVNAVGGNFNLDKGVSDSPLGTLEEKFDNKEKDCELEAAQQSNSICPENDTGSELDTHKYNGSVELDTNDTSDVIPSPEMSQMDIAPSGSPFSNESVDINSEADECMNESTPSSSTSDIAEPESVSYSCIGSNHCIGNSYMDDTNMEVVLYPDYVKYQEKYYTGSKLTFSNCCIKINGSTACINQGAINFEWAADDLIDINCQLFQSIGTIMIKVRVISSNADHSSNVNSASGIDELKIAVVDSNWSLRYKQITSLNVKYSDIWNIVLDTDVEVNENVLLGRRCYFPNFDEPFDEVIYPKGDPDAVSLSKRDVDLLQPDTFINDTVIDFYIKYLKTQIQEEKDRFHFFNSFFFRKLADMDKNPSSASDGKAAFLRVRKWTRKVNLFEKDYIFIPVNFNLHWSLIVICHPGEVVSFNDDDLDKSLKVPCILHMDSIKGSHSGLKNLLQSYLWEEWKERHMDRWEEDLSSRFFNMRFLPLALPQQENSFDCGLFVLHYLELFLAEAPANFNPFKLTKFSNFLNVDWFPPSEAYLKRTLIQRLIFELLENRNGESTTSHAGQGIEITLLSASSLDPQSFNHSGLVLRELFEPGATAGELVEQCQSFDHRSSGYRVNGSIYPIEEDAATETSEHFVYLTTDAKFQHVTPQTCEYPYLSRGCGAETCHRPEISPLAEHDKSESSSDTSGCSSDDSDDIGVVENCPAQNEAESSEEAKRYKKKFLSTENLCFTEIVDSAASNLPLTSVVGSLLDSDTKCGSNKNGVLPSSCEETTIKSLHQISDAVENEVSCDDVQMFNGMAPNICEEQAVKRRRLCESDSVGMTQESRL